jgi:hypothetical protein
MEKILYTRTDAAKMLSISLDTLDDLRRDGLLQGYQIALGNPRVYFKAAELAQFVERLEVAE